MTSDPSLFARVGQIGYAVRDLDSSVEKLRSANGAACRFEIFETVLDESGGYRYRGKPDECRLRIATTRFDAMDFELIQVLSGNHPARDYVEASGDGINHLGIYIDDLEYWKRHLVPDHAELVIEGSFHISDTRMGLFAYVKLTGGGPLYELIQM